MNTPKKNQVEIDSLYSNTSITKLGEYCLVQANLNINQILEIRNTALSPSKSNELRKKEQVFNSLNSPWIIEIVHKGAMCDALVEIWCIEMISQNYTSEEAIKNQVNYKRFDLLGRTIPWVGITFPCWTEHKKGGDKKQLFEAKLRLPNHDGKIEKPLLGIYECPSKDQPCEKCKSLGRKCTYTSPGISPLVNDDPNFYIDYAKDPNNQALCTLIGEIKTQLGDYRLQTIYFNDRIHNNMINKSVVTKSPAINLPKTTENPEIVSKSPMIIMDYNPATQKLPPPSTPPSHTKPISPSTSPIPVHHIPKPVQSDHGKSAPMNIHTSNADAHSFHIGTSKSSYSFDKELGEIFATSPNSLALQTNSPLWKSKRANNSTTPHDEKEKDECFQLGSPRSKIERRRSHRKSISLGSSVNQSGAEEIQFLIETGDQVSLKPTTEIERAKEYSDITFELEGT